MGELEWAVRFVHNENSTFIKAVTQFSRDSLPELVLCLSCWAGLSYVPFYD